MENTPCAEREKLLKSVFSSLSPIKMKTIPRKKESKRIVLTLVAGLFESGRNYTQPQVYEILAPVYDDPITLRRELVDAHILLRTSDGGRYWKNSECPACENSP